MAEILKKKAYNKREFSTYNLLLATIETMSVWYKTRITNQSGDTELNSKWH